MEDALYMSPEDNALYMRLHNVILDYGTHMPSKDGRGPYVSLQTSLGDYETPIIRRQEHVDNVSIRVQEHATDKLISNSYPLEFFEFVRADEEMLSRIADNEQTFPDYLAESIRLKQRFFVGLDLGIHPSHDSVLNFQANLVNATNRGYSDSISLVISDFAREYGNNISLGLSEVLENFQKDNLLDASALATVLMRNDSYEIEQFVTTADMARRERFSAINTYWQEEEHPLIRTSFELPEGIVGKLPYPLVSFPGMSSEDNDYTHIPAGENLVVRLSLGESGGGVVPFGESDLYKESIALVGFSHFTDLRVNLRVGDADMLMPFTPTRVWEHADYKIEFVDAANDLYRNALNNQPFSSLRELGEFGNSFKTLLYDNSADFAQNLTAALESNPEVRSIMNTILKKAKQAPDHYYSNSGGLVLREESPNVALLHDGLVSVIETRLAEREREESRSRVYPAFGVDASYDVHDTPTRGW